MVIKITQKIGTPPLAAIVSRDTICSDCEHDQADSRTQPGLEHVALLDSSRTLLPFAGIAISKNSPSARKAICP
jgi:hypothetical protein